MIVHNGDNTLVDESLLKELITEIRLLRLEISELNEHNSKKSTQDSPAKIKKQVSNQLSDNDPTMISIHDTNFLSNACCNALHRSGVFHPADLEYCTESQIKNMRMIGKRGFNYILKFAEKHGIEIGSKCSSQYAIEPGDQVICATDRVPKMPKGTVMVVDRVSPNSTKYSFSLPTYKCHVESNSKIEFSSFSRSELVLFNP